MLDANVSTTKQPYVSPTIEDYGSALELTHTTGPAVANPTADSVSSGGNTVYYTS